MEQFFNSKDIKTFEFKDLDDKTLYIKTFESEGVTIVAGKDIETGNMYVLSTNFKAC